ncbi:MAG: nitroreductase family protein [Pseudomonadota bacterium]
MTDALTKALATRFSDASAADVPDTALNTLTIMAARGSCRAFRNDPVAGSLMETLAAIALSSPTKSDLQQRDIILVRDPDQMGQIKALVSEQAWIADAPSLVIFCGNNRRQRQVQALRGHAFANDHLDAFFNAAVDAGIALGAFVTAAEAAGLGCCPISAVRNHPHEINDLLSLPDHVFPVAGLAVGYPAAKKPTISMRLPLAATVHVDRFNDDRIEEQIAAYDTARQAAQPYGCQRHVAVYGVAADYPWSEDKARQYGQPERADFGAFIRAKGFNPD